MSLYKDTLATLFKHIYQESKTGMLTVEGKNKYFFSFINGQIVNFEEWSSESNFLSFFPQSGFLSIDQIRIIKEDQMKMYTPIIDLLMKKDLIPNRVVSRIFDAYFITCLAKVFNHRHKFDFQPEQVTPSCNIMKLLDIEEIINKLDDLSDASMLITKYSENKLYKSIRVFDRHTTLIDHTIITNFVNSDVDFTSFIIFVHNCLLQKKRELICSR